MIIYFSGGGVVGVWERVNERLLSLRGARLLSFGYQQPLFAQYGELVRALKLPYKVKLMMDSGAFTAWTKGEQICREDLANMFSALLDRFGDVIDFTLINLDVIPGRKGVDPTPDQLLAAMKQSESNFDWLNEQFEGMVLPVFHQGEPSSYYDHLTEFYQYICLSPRNDLHEKLRIEWSRKFGLRDSTRKYHGLAATGLRMMETVNWYSVDSASWIMSGGYGNIFWRTPTRLQTVCVSAQSQSRKTFDAHLETLSPYHKDQLVSHIESRGYKLEALQNSDTERYMWNAEEWMRLNIQFRSTQGAGELFDV
jgi:hypothetical protein